MTHRPTDWTLVLTASALLALAAPSCGDDADGPYDGPVTLAIVGQAPAQGEAGATLDPPVLIEVRDAEGRARAGIVVALAVTGGGGSLAVSEATTDENGQISLPWTLGVAPVVNTVTALAGDASLDVVVEAVRSEALRPEAFGDVNGYLTDAEIEGSTEDLAFEDDARLIIGVPGGLLELDSEGVASAIPLTGDPILGPLGVAFDASGDLWVADAEAGALLRVSPEGVVTTVRTDDGRPGDDNRDLDGPNYIAFDAAGMLYLSDPCLGEVIRVDPDTGDADAWLAFDLATQGGPNGMAFDADGRMALATENTGLLCGHDFVGLVDELAGLYYVTVDAGGFGELETVVASAGLFGDGLAYDVEGNLYVIFDTQVDLQLEESAVWVLPAGEGELRALLSVDDTIFANLAFGRGDFGETTLYIATLAIVPFVAPETRGVMRFELGIAGLL